MSEVARDKVPFDYDGGNFSFARVVFANLALMIVTLGIFRFWARTRERRFLWSHVSLGEDRLEYTGRGLELFLGFLIVLVVMFPVVVAYYLLSLAASDSIPVQIVLSLLNLIVAMFLMHLAIYRARRYRLSRTLWRGIRGTLGGSSLRYALTALAWLPLVILSLGLAAPYMRVALMDLEVNNMHLGDRPFAFDGRARDLFAYWIVPWLILLAVIAGYAWFMYLISQFNDTMGVDLSDPESGTIDSESIDMEAATAAGDRFSQAGLMLAVGGLLYIIAIGWYRVREFRYLAGRVSFEGMRFASDIGFGRVVWIYVSYLFVAAAVTMMAGVGITLLLFAVSGAPMDPDMLGAGLDEDLEALIPITIMVTILVVLQPLSRIMVFHRLARTVITSLALTGVQDFSQVTQALDSSPRLGEGLADAFDLGDF